MSEDDSIIGLVYFIVAISIIIGIIYSIYAGVNYIIDSIASLFIPA